MIIKQKNKKYLIISLIILLLFLIIIMIIKHNQNIKQQNNLIQEQQRVLQYSSLEDFQTIQEVALYLNSEFIKQENLEDENFSYNIYMNLAKRPEENKQTNRVFYEKLIQYSAYVLKYKNFYIIDEEKNITVTVICEEEKSCVAKYYINEIGNYFDTKETQKNIKEISTITPIEVEIKSNELKNIISNNWSLKNINLGTKESTYRNYDIYFDEGIEVRNVNQKIFNIIFTGKYTENVINNITTSTTQNEIIKTLGKPHFESGSLIGYKCNNIYIFFYNNQISIYRIEEYNTDEIAQIIEQYISSEDIQNFINSIKSEWKDYDLYEYNENYVKLQYSLKGICFKYDNTTKQGVILYNNYIGKVCGNITFEQLLNNKQPVPSNIYIENENLVFKTEQTRVNTLDDTTAKNNYSSNIILNTSNEFKIYKTALEDDNSVYKIRFISINKKYPNSELRETINKGIWLDDYNFIYSVKQVGIFIYNVQTLTYSTVIRGNEEFSIQSIDGKTLYYDETSITINL